jgi:hypothetical protein
MLSALANAIVFSSLLILGVIVGVFLLAYAAHCFFTVLQGTAAGLDEVAWPDEPILDWLRQALHVLGLAAVWLVPSGILCRALRRDFLPDDGLLRFLLVLVPVFWLTFPVGVLSSLSGAVQWVPVRWTILRGMLRLFPATCAFYACTALLMATIVFLWYCTIVKDLWYLIPVAAVLSGAARLVYPRLLGRLAWLIGQNLPAPAQPRPRPFPMTGAGGKKKPPRPRRRKGRIRPTTVEDPWKIPDDFQPPPPPSGPRNPNLPPSACEIEPYAVSDDDDPPEPRPLPKRGGRVPDPDDEGGVYDLDPEPPVKPVFYPPLDGSEPAVPAAAVEQGQTNVTAAPGAGGAAKPPPPRPKPSVPARPLVSGVWSFPAYFTSRAAWFRLSVGWFVLGVLVQQALASFRTLPE